MGPVTGVHRPQWPLNCLQHQMEDSTGLSMEELQLLLYLGAPEEMHIADRILLIQVSRLMFQKWEVSQFKLYIIL